MDPRTAYEWSVRRYTCQPCVVLEAERENDTEGGRRERGRKYAVTRG